MELFTARVELPEVVMLPGLKLDEAPEGKPLRERFTVPAKPFRAETVAV